MSCCKASTSKKVSCMEIDVGLVVVGGVRCLAKEPNRGQMVEVMCQACLLLS